MKKAIVTFKALSLLVLALPCLAADDGSEVIEIKRPPVHAGIDLQYLPVTYSNFVWSGTNTIGSNTSLGFRFGADWIVLNKYGKLGVGAGVGFTMNLAGFDSGDGVARKFYTLPVDANLSYRLDYFKNQILVPYGKLGVEMALGQLEAQSLKQYWGLTYGFGIALLLNKLDLTSANNLFTNVGISYTYLTVEYDISSPFSVLPSTGNLSHAEFRAALRFEI